ncbi:MAG TPA: hypothetical protein VMS22_08280 [Candidatus Eisenbacteria bacterium]|nr:hypothetical protein [Candidatus Eisenbacteria bacterium]
MSSGRQRASRLLTAAVVALLTIAPLVTDTHEYKHVADHSKSCATCVAAYHCSGTVALAVVAPMVVPLVQAIECVAARDVLAAPASVRSGRAPPLLSTALVA